MLSSDKLAEDKMKIDIRNPNSFSGLDKTWWKELDINSLNKLSLVMDVMIDGLKINPNATRVMIPKVNFEKTGLEDAQYFLLLKNTSEKSFDNKLFGILNHDFEKALYWKGSKPKENNHNGIIFNFQSWGFTRVDVKKNILIIVTEPHLIIKKIIEFKKIIDNRIRLLEKGEELSIVIKNGRMEINYLNQNGKFYSTSLREECDSSLIIKYLLEVEKGKIYKYKSIAKEAFKDGDNDKRVRSALKYLCDKLKLPKGKNNKRKGPFLIETGLGLKNIPINTI